MYTHSMTADIFYSNIDLYITSILLIFYLIVSFIILRYVYPFIWKAIKNKLKKKKLNKLKNNEEINLELGYGTRTLLIGFFIYIFIDSILMGVLLDWIPIFYERFSNNSIIFLPTLFLIIIALPIFIIPAYLLIRFVLRDIHGFLSYLFLPQWFIFQKRKRTPEQYILFLEDCIKSANSDLVPDSHVVRNKYDSPGSMLSFKEQKLVQKRYSTLKKFAQGELRKIENILS